MTQIWQRFLQFALLICAIMQLLLIVDLLRVKIEFVSIEQPLQEERLGVKKRVVSRLDFYAGIWHNFSYSKSDLLLARDEMCILLLLG